MACERLRAAGTTLKRVDLAASWVYGSENVCPNRALEGSRACKERSGCGKQPAGATTTERNHNKRNQRESLEREQNTAREDRGDSGTTREIIYF